MANFPPLKLRFLEALDAALMRIRPAPGRFLDFGCGVADVALHVKSHWKMEGELVEASSEARERLKSNPATACMTCHSSLDGVDQGAFSLAVAFDVLEHLPDPATELTRLHAVLAPKGLLAVIIPYRPSTWGWDDEFYGHLRRWTADETALALKVAGFEVLEMRDPTFPLYSTLRWLMLRLRRPVQGGDVAEVASQQSSLQSSWGAVPPWTKWVPWRLLHRLSDPLSRCLKGDELFVLARKMNRS